MGDAPESRELPAVSPGESPEGSEERIERLLRFVPEGREVSTPVVLPSGLTVGALVETNGDEVVVNVRGKEYPVRVAVHVDPSFIASSERASSMVLVDFSVEPPQLVGLVQTGFPRNLRIEAERLEFVGRHEVSLSSGRSALRLREDGSVDLVGSRISAASRGLFRLVGRALRLN